MPLVLPREYSADLVTPLSWQHFDNIDSTNAYLLDKNQATNQLISADKQSHGRGRHQQQWVDEGQSALFSLSTTFDKKADITAWPVQVALTLAESLNVLLAHFSNQPLEPLIKIKWPNDLYMVNKNHWGKCAGILVESTIGKKSKVVTGIGINLATLQTPLSADYSASYIDLPIDKKTLIVLLANRLFTAWKQLNQNPSISTSDYQKFDILFGHSLIATDLHTGIQQTGIGAGVNTQGHLLLKQNNKQLALTSQQRIRFAHG